jgi:hypothetical protein
VEFALQIIGYVVGLPLEILIISALLRGPYRRFPFVFAYIIALFLATLVQIPSYILFYTGGAGVQVRSRAWVYWLTEAFILPLLLAVVLSLIWQAAEFARTRRLIRFSLFPVAALLVGGSFIVHYSAGPAKVGVWMTSLACDINFAAAILDLVLWMMLATQREKDRTILLLSGGLGIQFTAEAVGQSLRALAVSLFGGPTPWAYAMVLGGNLIIMLANLGCLWIWRQALRAQGHSTSVMEAGVKT